METQNKPKNFATVCAADVMFDRRGVPSALSLSEAAAPSGAFSVAVCSPPFWPCPNNCMKLCRDDVWIIDGRPIATNHHPRCEYVDASLVTAYRVSEPGDIFGCIVADEASAKQMSSEDPDAPLEITPIKIHREILENLPEFGGF